MVAAGRFHQEAVVGSKNITLLDNDTHACNIINISLSQTFVSKLHKVAELVSKLSLRHRSLISNAGGNNIL